MVTDPIDVAVWAHQGRGDWAVVGGVTYERIEFEPRDKDTGSWACTLPYGDQSRAVLPDRLTTTDFRGSLWTWTVSPRTMTLADDGNLSVILGGFDALAILGRPICYPTPTAAVTAQTAAEWKLTGPAETVIRSLVVANLSRTGVIFDAPASQGRGAMVTSAVRFENLLTEVQRLARAGNIGVRFGLVTTSSSTRARLQLWFEEPADKTTRVQLAAADGSLASWEFVENEPTATKAIVGGIGEGPGQKLVEVTTPESVADAAAWGGHREVYVDGPDTFDQQPYVDAGQEALREGAATTTLSMEADEPAGTRAFEAFQVGDRVTAIPIEGTEIPDTISAIRVVHEEGGDPEVTPMFGDPDLANDDEAAAADAFMAKQHRDLMRKFRAAIINRKRGEV